MFSKKFIFFILISALYGTGKSQNNSDSLVGVWQDSKIVASGWSNTFLFFKSGEFRFFYNQMDCAKREVSFSGKWKVSGEELRLKVMQKNIIKGGTMELSSGSCASDSMIVGGVEKTVKLKPPEVLVYSVSQIYADNRDDIQRLKVYIDAMNYWKFSDNPDEMLNQFEIEK
jgi:hypothetical protein